MTEDVEFGVCLSRVHESRLVFKQVANCLFKVAALFCCEIHSQGTLLKEKQNQCKVDFFQDFCFKAKTFRVKMIRRENDI